MKSICIIEYHTYLKPFYDVICVCGLYIGIAFAKSEGIDFIETSALTGISKIILLIHTYYLHHILHTSY